MTWRLQAYAGPGPFTVEKVGHVWMALNPQGYNVLFNDRGRVWFYSAETCQSALGEALKPRPPEWLARWLASIESMKQRYAHTYEVKH